LKDTPFFLIDEEEEEEEVVEAQSSEELLSREELEVERTNPGTVDVTSASTSLE
jgi:hypothetical protein